MRQYRSLATVLVGVLAGSARIGATQEPPRSGPTIMVLNFTNAALVDHDSYEPLSYGLIDMLSSELKGNPDIQVVERSQLGALLKEQDLGASKRVDPTTAARVGKILGAHYVLTGGFIIDRKGQLRLDARAVNVETSAVAHVETVTGAADDVLVLVSKLAQQMNSSMKLPPIRTSRLGAGRPTAPKRGVMKAAMLYSTAVLADGNGKPGEALSLFSQFLQETPQDTMVDLRQKAEERIKALKGGGS